MPISEKQSLGVGRPLDGTHSSDQQKIYVGVSRFRYVLVLIHQRAAGVGVRFGVIEDEWDLFLYVTGACAALTSQSAIARRVRQLVRIKNYRPNMKLLHVG